MTALGIRGRVCAEWAVRIELIRPSREAHQGDLSGGATAAGGLQGAGTDQAGLSDERQRQQDTSAFLLSYTPGVPGSSLS